MGIRTVKWIPALLILLLSAPAFGNSRIVGEWLFYKKVFDGIEMPEPPGATLRLYFEFAEDGDSRLVWWHEGEGDYCERRGAYTVEDDLLIDEVVWVNPRNSRECARDPDMQLGRVTRTPFSFLGDDLVLHLHLQDKPLLYVWKRTRP